MAKLFFFVAVALVLISSCAARDAQAPAPAPMNAEGQLEGFVVPVNASQVYAAEAQYQINIGDRGIVRCRKISPKDCMLGVLLEAGNLPYCKGRCNIFIHNSVFKHGFGFKTVILPQQYYMDIFYLDGDRYQVFLFHDSAYWETSGWYGWGNWAFAGNFAHTTNTPIVKFFPYGPA